MKADAVIRKELLALLQGGNAHMEFDEAIDDFPLGYINRKAPRIPYSPWHFLEHMRITQWDILEFIRNPGHASPDYPQGYRPAAGRRADRMQWKKTVAGFRADLKSLKDIVRDETTDFFRPLPHAKDYTIFREILLAADHNAYHIGEFALLRQMLNIWPIEKQYLTGTAG